MQSDTEFLQREVIQMLQRKRRHGRSLTDSELKQILQMNGFEKETSMSSEDLLITSPCRDASLSIEGEKDDYMKSRSCRNERT